jgi:hypothetical protein
LLYQLSYFNCFVHSKKKRSGEEKTFFPCHRSNTNHPAHSIIIILTEISRHRDECMIIYYHYLNLAACDNWFKMYDTGTQERMKEGIEMYGG